MAIVQAVLLLAIAALAVLNGQMLSPLFDSFAYVLYLFNRGSAYLRGELLNYLTSAFISALTLVLGGLPAALYERIRGLRASTPVSLAIWLIATALLTLPTLRRLAGGD